LGLDVIYLDTPNDKVEKSSSYDLSIFSSGANSQGAKIIAVTPGDSSPSIGELWLDKDKLDEISREDTSVMPARNILVCGRRLTVSAEKASRRSRRKGKKALLKDVPRCLILN
jgi:hypothetical protein